MPDRPPRPGTDALAQTADALARRALAALPADRPHGRADVARLPPPVARLLAARLDAAVRTAAPSSPWVDGDDPAVRAAAEAWGAAARAASRFPADVWDGAVRWATEQALRHLVRPAETLAASAFAGESGPIPASVAVARARAFGPYAYLPEVAGRYVERKELAQLSRAEMEQLLARIDRRMVATYGPDEWTDALAPLFDLAGPVGEPRDAVPAALLRDTLRSRDAGALADALGSDDALDAEGFRLRLAAALAPEPTPSPAPPAAQTPAAPPEPAEAPRIATAPPALTPPPLPPVAEGVRPPVIGSKFGAPEPDDETSEILGPPRPASRSAPEAPTPEPSPSERPPSERLPSGRPSASAMETVRDAVAAPADDLPASPVLNPPEQATPPAPVADSGPAPDPEPPPPSEPAASEPAAPPSAVEAEPIWMRLAREQGVEPTPDSDAPAADTDEPIWKRFVSSDLVDSLPDRPSDPEGPAPRAAPAPADVSDLETRVLGAEAGERRAWYVAELFGGSDADYERTLAALDAATTYTDATRVIEAEMFKRHSVSPYTEASVTFIDDVQRQFGE